jgi:hypothetical protein
MNRLIYLKVYSLQGIVQGLEFLFKDLICCYTIDLGAMGLHHWQCRASGDNDILCTKRKQSGKDSVIEAQPLLLFM